MSERIHTMLSTPAILDNVLDAVGNTPLIRLDRIASQENLKCNLFAKVEFFNPGGSVKDRIARRMVQKAEEDGTLIRGKSIVIEPTSGNTGIGLALVCALKGYPVIITLPEKMSLEKEVTLRALGAEIVRTPTSAPSESEFSNIGVAKKLQRLIPHGVILNQYENTNNPEAHEFGTGPEIIEAITRHSTSERPSSGKVDCFVAGAGTGGTVSGTSRALKKHNKDAVVVGVDPKGSILAQPSSLNVLDGQDSSYAVEGIGYDFIPPVLAYSAIDTWVKVTDEEAWVAARQVMRSEGLLVGGSSGSALAGTLQYLKSQEGRKNFGDVEGKNVVVLFPDGIRNYISKPWFIDSLDAGGPSTLMTQISQVLSASDNTGDSSGA